MSESQKAFEESAMINLGFSEEDFGFDGEYTYKPVQAHWETWQAATRWADS